MSWSSRNPTRVGFTDAVLLDRARFGRHREVPAGARGMGERIRLRQVYSRYVLVEAGSIVVEGARAFRVDSVAEIHPDLWPTDYLEAYDLHRQDAARFGRPVQDREVWCARPHALTMTPEAGDGAGTLHDAIARADYRWEVLGEHYATCRVCGHLPPCPEEVAELEAARQMAVAEELLTIPAGHCLGCGEAITSRQQRLWFPGPNLWRPDLAEGSAVFHARRECGPAADRYRDAYETRSRT